MEILLNLKYLSSGLYPNEDSAVRASPHPAGGLAGVLEMSPVQHLLAQRQHCGGTHIAVQHGGQVIYYEA
jgi:hypothetical protein